MIRDSSSLCNSEIFHYSDSDVSSFGSLDSDYDREEIELDNIHLSSHQFFKLTTPGISIQVLNLDNNKIEEIQINEIKCSQNDQIDECSEPKVINSLIGIKQVGENLNKYHQEIENNLTELKKSHNHLQELGKLNKDHENTKEMIEEIKKQPKNIYQQIKIANNQLDGVQKQLFNFFDEFNTDQMRINDNGSSYSKMMGKAKEISDSIETSIPLFCEEANGSGIKNHDSFEALCQHVDSIISEMDNIGKKLNELLDI